MKEVISVTHVDFGKERSCKLFVGDEQDYTNLEKEHIPGREADQPTNNFAIIHACKEPFHRQLLGYTGRGAPKDHPEYLYSERENRLFMNIVDAPKSIFFDKGLIDKALDFIGRKLNEGLNVLVHCNEGMSRSPSIALLYLIKHGLIEGEILEDCEAEFLKLYPKYNPGTGMRGFVKENFEEYKPKLVTMQGGNRFGVRGDDIVLKESIEFLANALTEDE